MNKVAFDLGHGCNYDGGAVGLVTEESIINAIGNRVIAIWREEGNEAIETRPSNVASLSDSLKKRCNVANANNCELMVSIHANVTSGGHGVEVFTYKGKELASARMVLNNIAALGLSNRGIKDASLFITNNSNMDAMLIEVLFCDNASDLAIYNEKGVEAFAQAIIAGIKCHVASYSNGESDPVYQKAIASYDPIKSGRKFIGNRCVELQNKLISLGYSCGNSGADGDFGTNTYNALIKFQKEYGLTADGLAGELTFEKLYNVVAMKTEIAAGNDWTRRLQQEFNNQLNSGLSEDGIPGPKTLAAAPTLKYGSAGNITKLLQEKLKIYIPWVGYDGIFGEQTKRVIIKFQGDNGLVVDGIVGKNTWRKLLGLS